MACILSGFLIFQILSTIYLATNQGVRNQLEILSASAEILKS